MIYTIIKTKASVIMHVDLKNLVSESEKVLVVFMDM